MQLHLVFCMIEFQIFINILFFSRHNELFKIHRCKHEHHIYYEKYTENIAVKCSFYISNNMRKDLNRFKKGEGINKIKRMVILFILLYE